MLPCDLENWLTEAGDRVVKHAAALGDASLTDHEQLLHEIWLFDTEQRNGGVSQYFANQGRPRWKTLCGLASRSLPSFNAFAAEVDPVIDGAADAYEAIIASKIDLDGAYIAMQTKMVIELKGRLEAH